MQLMWHGIADRYHVRLGIDGLGLILLFKVSNEASPSFFYGVAGAEMFHPARLQGLFGVAAPRSPPFGLPPAAGERGGGRSAARARNPLCLGWTKHSEATDVDWRTQEKHVDANALVVVGAGR